MDHRYGAAFLDLSSTGGMVHRRWQSRWIHQTITWEALTWDYREFEWAGLSSGAVIDSAPAGLTFAHLSDTADDLRLAHQQQWVGRLRVYHYPDTWAGSGPPTDQVLVGSYTGTLSLESVSQDVISVALGGEAGGVFPPRRADSSLIGLPCELGGR
jgi:hypothetical protein